MANCRPDDITQGARLRAASWGGIRAIESSHAADLRLSPHRHAASCLTYVLEGDFVERVEGRELHMRRGSVLLKQSDAVHTNHFGGSGARSLLVELPAAMLERFEDRRSLFASDPVRTVPGAARNAHRIHAELLESDPVSEMVVEGLLLEVLGRAVRAGDRGSPESAPPRWLVRVRDALHEQFADPPCLTELAREADVHPDHLGRTFRRHYGLSPGAYVRRVRIEHAVRLITETERPLAEVAYVTGFADQSHMTRQVGAATGLPPGRLRERVIRRGVR